MANETKTAWYRNIETDVAWEVEVGSVLEKRLKRELTDDPDNPEPRYERLRSAPKASAE